MSQHESLRNRKEQHKPKNMKSKKDDKDIYLAMNYVHLYLLERFKMLTDYPDYEIVFEKNIEVKYMIELIKKAGLRNEFEYKYIDRTIVPDGGVLYLHNKKTKEKLPLVIAEIKTKASYWQCD